MTIDLADTIVAISTPAGEGAIALIRISGPEAIAVADAIFRGQQKAAQFASHVQHLGEIVEEERVIDQVVLSVHRAPQSYTGEDLVEVSCHGGVVVTANVLAACLRGGARHARPGEFTERAFLNNKMDLTQAEAVMDLIRAQTDLAARSATEQLEGKLGAAIKNIRDSLVELLAHIDASIDFSEEGIAPDEGEQLLARLDATREKIERLLATAESGRILREGVRAVIYGPTNAGKSSLLNRLLGYDRAIVSPIAGTTRDTIEEVINLRGLALRLLDTAGLRETNDELERAGIARTEKSLGAADLALHVVDGSAPRPPEFSRREGLRELLLFNKSDLPEHADWNGCDGLRISCLREDGLAGLDDRILSEVGAQHLRAQSGLAINARHRDCLRRALESCDLARGALSEGLSVEYAAVDLHAALRATTEVIALERDDA
ncbi:MAG: tRNA uridine-5-carboxymethylaminomethyl(34) synthesis GTPase MnmE, partial [Verrucomicrobiota bacterium]|nr:tRNA uridine-5-carboxymethylaminomethyl(34) synthesis GTPase MnmE [Verrucomicrobiota bacterium]